MTPAPPPSGKAYFARTGWLTIALVPTPIAFFLPSSSNSDTALHTGTTLIRLSLGFIFAIVVSITSELFGPNSVGVNHNILITNIHVGSLLYGVLSALVYEANASSVQGFFTDSVVVVSCLGQTDERGSRGGHQNWIVGVVVCSSMDDGLKEMKNVGIV
ncbi:hypothetical protein RJ639_009147 [Escallonia herrerae]|uniref:NFD4 C-terminal domain-containing protein n=1 Tax=Escallonia herrerae TaxID=1293975 RepID=A0AA88VUT4_9ASTE|nr:hypothetical protein RJ639_009147 [Escallonia herrerae]